MSEPASARVTVLGRATSFVAGATIVRDVNQLQNAAFCEAMSVYVGNLDVEEIDDDNRHYYDALQAYGRELPGDQLDDRARPVYYVLSAMKAILEDFDQILEEFHDEIEGAVQELMEKQSSRVAADIERYIKHLPAKWRSFWLIVALGSVGWQTSLVKGPDPSFIPLRIPVLIRTVAIYADWILHPTASHRQFVDMFTQRTLTAAPQQMLYTVAMITALEGTSGIYKANWYQPINIGLALGAVSAVIAAAQWTAHRTGRKIKSGAQQLAPQIGEAQSRAELRRRLIENAGKMKIAQSWAKRLKEKHELSPGETNAFGQFMTDIDELLKMVNELAQLPSPRENPERAKKLEPVYVCLAFSALQILAAARNPISLGLALSWSEYSLYRLIEHVTKPARSVEETWTLLDQVGGIVPAQLLLHSLPLALDKDAFKRRWLLTFSTTLLSVLQGTVSHKTGPLVSAGSKLAIRGAKSTVRLTGRQLQKFSYQHMRRLLRISAGAASERPDEGAEDQGVELELSSAPYALRISSPMSSMVADQAAAETGGASSFWQLVKHWEEMAQNGSEDGQEDGDEEPLWAWVKDMEEQDGEMEKQSPDLDMEWAERLPALQPLFDEGDEFAWMDDVIADFRSMQGSHDGADNMMADLLLEIDAMMLEE